jgi:hypothetical protein
VEEHGWFCSSVFDPSKVKPSFNYSVGFLETLKCPEFIVFGLDGKLSHSILWDVYRRIRSGAAVPGDMQHWTGVLVGHDLISRAVHPSQIDEEYFNSALWYAWRSGMERDDVKAFQLFWPGVKRGLFPWENGCEQSVRDLQPLLYLPHEEGIA